MGKINQGILGGFSGKVGTVVGGSWKGTAYMRGLPTHYTATQSESVIFCRKALRAVIEALRPLAPTLKLTFGNYDHKMSTFNKAAQINYYAAIEKVDGEPVVNYKKLILSKGFLKSFDMFFVDDPGQDGHWYVGAIQYDNSHVEYPGFIFILNELGTNNWFSYIYDQPFTTGLSDIEIEGFPITSEKQYLGWAFVYDKSLGQVSEKCRDFYSPNINDD